MLAFISKPAAQPGSAKNAVQGLALWRVWLHAVRPRSFTTSTIPIIAATALALVDGSVKPDLFILMVLASIFTHAACNLTNDYFDDRRGVDSAETLGQGGALQAGSLSHADIRNGIVVSFVLAVLCAVPVIIAVGPIVIGIGIASAAAAFFYTAGPFPLAYYALGEITVFLAMGIGMVCGSYYVNTENITTSAILLAIAIGLLTAGFLHANNVRDSETDRARNKRTLANLLPKSMATAEYAFLVVTPYLLAIVMVVIQPRLFPILLVWLSFPVAFGLIKRIRTSTERVELNAVTRQSAGLHLRYCTLTSIGLVLAAMIVR